MKFLKGCLIVILIFGVIITLLIFIYNHKISKEVIQENEKPKQSLIEYKNKILERNNLIINSNLSDSLKILAKKSDSILNNSKKLNEPVVHLGNTNF